MTGENSVSLGMKSETIRVERLETAEEEIYLRSFSEIASFFFQSVFVYFIHHQVFLKWNENWRLFQQPA